MLRNLNHRIEIVFPVESPSLVQRIRHEILEVYLADNVNAYQAHSDGSYTRAPRSETTGGVDSHQRFMTRTGARGFTGMNASESRRASFVQRRFGVTSILSCWMLDSYAG